MRRVLWRLFLQHRRQQVPDIPSRGLPFASAALYKVGRVPSRTLIRSPPHANVGIGSTQIVAFIFFSGVPMNANTTAYSIDICSLSGGEKSF
jgi:hypothetical protein